MKVLPEFKYLMLDISIYLFVCCINYYMLTEGARAALNLSGTMLGYYPVRVLPSKTAIAPVNPTFLPRVRPYLYAIIYVSLNIQHIFLQFSFHWYRVC